jgi:hypothetical protein
MKLNGYFRKNSIHVSYEITLETSDKWLAVCSFIHNDMLIMETGVFSNDVTLVTIHNWLCLQVDKQYQPKYVNSIPNIQINSI